MVACPPTAGGSKLASSIVSSTPEGERERDGAAWGIGRELGEAAGTIPDGRSRRSFVAPTASARRAWNSVGGSHFAVAAVSGRS
jgi:hypothetical protein